MLLVHTTDLVFQKINATCPIVHISWGPPITFVPDPKATPAQITAAQSIVDQITLTTLATIETAIKAAAAALPDPLAIAKATALASLPTAAAAPVLG